jgi:uncharacterized protein (DUF697 family)/GTP-binding protein EngB required for normal cell division
MAIDKKQVKGLLGSIDGLFEQVLHAMPIKVPMEVVQFIKDKVMGAAVDELRDLVVNARPPRLYLMGRSGHGKSTLINALANREVAVVGHVEPTTMQSEIHRIEFPEVHAAWEIIDSRGIFEAMRPDGAPGRNAVEQVQEDILKHKPDVILHAIAARETRSMSEDVRVGKEVRELIKRKLHVVPPTVIVLTQTDLLEPAREWPPTPGGRKMTRIKEILDFVVGKIIGAKAFEPFDKAEPAYGYKITEESFVSGVIPVAAPAPPEPFWNVEQLSECIGQLIPKEAQLDFFQAQQRKALLKNVALNMVDRFATTAALIGSTPLPIADMFLLTPLQMLMVAMVGGLSCRSMTVATAGEFMGASGATVAAGFALREVARQAMKFVPFLGAPVAGGIAYSGTRAVGRSAVSYFFLGELRQPQEFMIDEARP